MKESAAAVPWAAVLGVAWVLWGPGSGAGSPGLAGLLGGPGGSRRVQGGGLLPGASRCSGDSDVFIPEKLRISGLELTQRAELDLICHRMPEDRSENRHDMIGPGPAFPGFHPGRER